MQLVELVNLWISALIILLFCKFIIKKIFEKRTIKIIKTEFLYLIFCATVILLINVYNKNIFKILMTLPFSAFYIKGVFNNTYKTSFLYAIVGNTYIFIGEIFAAIVVSMLPFNYAFIFNNILGKILGTLLVIIFTLPFLYLKPMNKIVRNLIDKISSDKRALKFIGVLVVLSIAALGYKMSINAYDFISTIMNLMIFIIMLIMLYFLYMETKKSSKLSENYNMLLSYLEKYENELVEKRKVIHDYKNQLIIINGYSDCPSKLKPYLSEIMTEQKSLPESSIIKNIDKLPKGLKGLVYYKLAQLEQKIEIEIDIKGNLKKFDKLDSKISKDVLKIVGILIDNAIEACTDEQTKYINLNFTVTKGIFNIIITNCCTKTIKKENIMDNGYSTKGKERGYGLSIIKDITKREKRINFKFLIENNEFSAYVEIKL